MIPVIWAFATSRVGMIVFASVLALSAVAVVIHRHDAQIIEAHDAQAAVKIQEKVDESIQRGNALPVDPDRVQSNDRWCRDCR